MEVNAAQYREIETDANYVGGRDGSQVFFLPRDMKLFETQKGASLIKIFRDPILPQKELDISRTLRNGHVSVVNTHGVVSCLTENGTKYGLVMDEIKGIPFGNIPKNKKQSAFESYVYQVIGALSLKVEPRDQFWNQNVLYEDQGNEFHPVLFDFSRWKMREVEPGRGLEFLMENCEYGRCEFMPRALKTAYKRDSIYT